MPTRKSSTIPPRYKEILFLLKRKMDGRDAVNYVLSKNIPGALVECGCGSGNYQLQWIQELQSHQSLRDIYMYDTFAGLTEPSEKDYAVADSANYQMSSNEVKEHWLSKKVSAQENAWCNWSLESVMASLSRTQYPGSYLHYIVGDIRQTLLYSKNIPDEIAVLRLDTDWYDSSKLELEVLFPKVVPGGVVIFDDYNHWNGQRQATDEYFQSIGKQYTHVKIDGKTTAIFK